MRWTLSKATAMSISKSLCGCKMAQFPGVFTVLCAFPEMFWGWYNVNSL